MTISTAFLALPGQLPLQPAEGGDDCGGGIGGLACRAGDAIGGAASDAAGSVASAAAGSAFESMVNAIKDGVGKAMGLLLSFWMDIPIPSIGDPDSAVGRLHDATLYLTIITAVISLFFVAGKAALAQRNASTEAAGEAAKGLGRIVVASTVAIPAVVLASQGADEYAAWLVDQAANGDVDTALTNLTGINQGLGVGFTFIMALLALVASLVQAFLILVRDALLILLVGALPLAAASSVTGQGKATFTKMTGWLIAFVVFKPVAAMCYAAALWSVSDTSQPMNQVAGLFLVVLAVFTLPALMRLIVPQVEKVGGGGGVALMAGAGAAMNGGSSPSGSASHGAAKSSSGGSSGGGGQAAFKGQQGASGSSSSPGGAGSGASGAGGRPGSKGGGAGASGPAAGGGGAASGSGGGGAGAGAGAAGAAGAAAMVAQKTVGAVKGAGQVTGSAAEGAIDGHEA